MGTVNVNAALVEQGAAWVYRQYPHPPELETLEAQAQAAKRGLWALQPDQRYPPWNWRRKSCQPDTKPPEPSGCGSKHTCKEMSSCEEARFYLTQCGVSRLDGDKDGTPCEALCR